MAGILEGFLLLAVVIGVGYLVGGSGALGPEARSVLSRLAVTVGTPALLLSTIATADLGAVFTPTLLVVVVTSVLVMGLYVLLAGRGRPLGEATVGAMASGWLNAGNLGIPIAVYVLGSITWVAPVMLFQLAVVAPTASVLLERAGAGPRRRSGSRARAVTAALAGPARNPVLIASAVAVVLSAADVRLPAPVMAPIDLLAGVSVPAMLLAFGISLHGSRLPGVDGLRRQIATAVALRAVVHPLLALGAALLVGLEGTALLAAVTIAAFPTAQNVFGYASRYEQSTDLARDVVLVSTVVSVPVLLVVAALLA